MANPDGQTKSNKPTAPTDGWRIKLGATVFVLSILAPTAGIPLVSSFDLSGSLLAAISGGLLVTGEVLGVAAVAIMGKPGYDYVKSLFFGVLRRVGPPRVVSRFRYRVGLMMFCIPILFGWLAPYLSELIDIHRHMLILAIAGDAVLLASLFVLGGDFWDKLQSLFVHDAKVSQ
jgi:hypothetical protein